MAQSINLKAAGLQTFYQSLSEIAPGALLKANNTVIDRSGVIAPRRGIAVYSAKLNNPIKQLMEYKGRILRHVEETLSYDNGFGTFTNFSGQYIEASSGYRLKSVEAKSNFYFATLNGVKKISATSPNDFSIIDIIQEAGGAKAIAGTLQLTGTSGYLRKGNTVAYRILWLYTDRNQNLILGAPSTPMVITNDSDGDRNVELKFQVPYNVNAEEYKYRIYRSEMSTFGTPSDEVYQVFEASITAAQLLSREIIVVDSLAEDLRLAGIPLYTNQYSGEGALKANEPPPAAKDIALFKGHMFYANTRTRHRCIFTLISVDGLTAGTSTLVVNGVTYTFDTVEDAALKKIKIGSIEETAKSFVRVVNADPNEEVSGYYLSVFGEAPGKILLEKKNLNDDSFYVGTTDASIVLNFNPEIGTGATLTTKLVSTTEKFGNRLYYSKYQELEAVPLLNYIDIGSRDQEIDRIVALRESLFVFKGDGVFRLAGDPGANPTWDIGVFDNTSIIKAPDTAVTLGNQCYYFSNQGVMRLNESSLEPVSEPIHDKLLPFLATSPALETASFSVAYESDKALLMWTVSKKTDTTATVCYRYNIITQAWTEWKISKTCAVLNEPQDKLYFGSSDNYIEVERKNFDRFDYADRELVTELLADKLNGKIILLPNFQALAVGDVVLQEQYVTLTEVNATLKQLDLDGKLKVRGFYNELKMSIGDNLNTTLINLRNKLRQADPAADWSGPDIHGNTDYEFTPSSSFETIQEQYNEMIDRLNQSPNSFLKNYVKSTGIKRYESHITNLNNINFEITLHVAPAFLQGKLIIYKGIITEIEYAPQHAENPASYKQFSTGTFMFERRSFFTAEIGYNSDISDNFEEISITTTSAGTFGGMSWGDGTIWGGQGDQSQIRTYIPARKQRCRFLGCKMIHRIALESFQLYGLTLSVRQYVIPDRDYK